MKYYCVEGGCDMPNNGTRPKFCPICSFPQTKEAMAIKLKAKLKPKKPDPEPEEENEEDETEEEIELPTSLNIKVDLGGLGHQPINLGSVFNTSREGRGGFRRPANDKYIETVQKKFKDREPIDLSL